MKRIALLSIIIILTFSCSKDDENQSEIKIENYILYKHTQTFSYNGNVSIVEYDYKNGLLESAKETNKNGTFITYYNYNSNGQLESGTNSYGKEYTLTYTGDKITKESYFENDDHYVFEYKYDNNGNVESEKQYKNNGLTTGFLFKYDKKNNPIEWTIIDSDRTNTFTQTFDNKKNPYRTIFTKEYLIISGLNGENNLLESYPGDTKSVYEYNDNGYPTKETIYHMGKIESVVEFEYK